MQTLHTWIKHIVLIILFATFLELLLPDNNYKKFVKVIMGLLVLQAVLQPVLNLVHNEWQEPKVADVTSHLIVDKPQEMTNQATKIQLERDRLALEQYRRELTKQVQVLASSVAGVADVNVSVAVNEQKNEKGYGAIKNITLFAKAGKTEKDKAFIKPIQQVEVGDEKNTTSVLPVLNEQVKAQLKRVITEFYHLSANQVTIIDAQGH